MSRRGDLLVAETAERHVRGEITRQTLATAAVAAARTLRGTSRGVAAEALDVASRWARGEATDEEVRAAHAATLATRARRGTVKADAVSAARAALDVARLSSGRLPSGEWGNAMAAASAVWCADEAWAFANAAATGATDTMSAALAARAERRDAVFAAVSAVL